jgi:8-oxo-dGTP diphosphatase
MLRKERVIDMKYRSPKLTVDAIVTKNDDEILLVKRGKEPFKNYWALPGGFVNYGEKVEDAVIRETFEETGLRGKINRLIGVYSAPDRDPRGHTVSIVYHLKIVGGELKGRDDACDAKFFKIKDIPSLPLAFDHKKIIEDYLEYSRRC